MFVWIFHRISGLLLILLVGLQVVSGVFQANPSAGGAAAAVAELHNQPALNVVLVFLFIFHGLYGIRTILMDAGVRAEKGLFWGSTLLGTVLFAAFCVFYFSLVAG